MNKKNATCKMYHTLNKMVATCEDVLMSLLKIVDEKDFFKMQNNRNEKAITELNWQT
jgi:hypothetical protein